MRLVGWGIIVGGPSPHSSDDTLPAPWEWDVKRLTVNVAAAARDNGHSDDDAREVTVECVRAYREHLRGSSKKSPLEVWYEHLDIRTLPDDRRVLFVCYRLADVAMKVVGIGSVGTRCHVALFHPAEGHPLLLQFKEPRTSVLAPYAGKSVQRNQGQRIVVGQRLMQPASDIFLGWTQGRLGFVFLGRQLRDMKISVDLE